MTGAAPIPSEPVQLAIQSQDVALNFAVVDYRVTDRHGQFVNGSPQVTPADEERRAHFHKVQGPLNDKIVAYEHAKFGKDDDAPVYRVRWLSSRCRPGEPFRWGCGICFGLVTSAAFRDFQKTDRRIKISKLGIARMDASTKPTLKSLQVHAGSALHQCALKFHFSAGVSLSALSLPPPNSRVQSADGAFHGEPTFHQWAEAWFMLRRMVSARTHAGLQELQNYCGRAAVTRVNCGQLLQLAVCFADVLKQEWRSELKVCETCNLSFDGHRHVEDVHFNCMSMDRLEVVQGCLGLVEPWKGDKAQLDSTTKSQRTVAGIDNLITEFGDGDVSIGQSIRSKTHAISRPMRRSSTGSETSGH